MKKYLALLLAVLMLAAVFTGCASKETTTDTPAASTDTAEPAKTDENTAAEETPAAEPASEEGKVFNIYAWNEEFKGFFEKYYTVPEGVTVNWIITPSADGAYQDKLDEALLNQENASADDKVDLFLAEADYIQKYTESPVTQDVTALGVTDFSSTYAYTVQAASDASGVVKGVSFQCCPAALIYRRSIAKDVLGTDDPDAVQEALSDWDKFNAVAEQAAAKGYYMLSGYDDAYRTFSNNVSAPWVADDGETVVVDANLMKWVDQTKTYTDKGYNHKSSLWDATWAADQGPTGKVFGFFYSTWGINFTLLGNSLETSVKNGGKEEVGNGAYGDYAVCQGPQAYYWGGTWICAAAGTDNVATIKDVMQKLTCDAAIAKKITEDTQDYTNNVAAMNELAQNYSSAFLGGQNHIALFAEAAPKIDMSNISAYDQGLNESFQGAFKNYFDGNATIDEAKAQFESIISEKYPELVNFQWPDAK